MRTVIWKTSFRLIWLAIFLATTLAQRVGLAEEYFMFTSFRGNGEDGLHLAISTNGYRWQALKHDHSFLKPGRGQVLPGVQR